MYGEDDLLPLSGLQHLAFCERQWALIHVEQLWDENYYTAQGRLLHETVHERPGYETREGVVAARGLALRSLAMGLFGIADIVEFVRDDAHGVAVPWDSERWTMAPVEYKRGTPKAGDCDRVQLCAQAMCLEEMFDCGIASADLFYGRSRRRERVALSDALRGRVVELAKRAHELLEFKVTPPPAEGPQCRRCSLRNQCLPSVCSQDVAAYWANRTDGLLGRVAH